MRPIYTLCVPDCTLKLRVEFYSDYGYKKKLKELNAHAGAAMCWTFQQPKNCVATIYINKDKATQSMLNHEIIHAAFGYMRYNGVLGVCVHPIAHAKDPKPVFYRMEENFCSVFEFMYRRIQINMKRRGIVLQDEKGNGRMDFLGAKACYGFPFKYGN